MEKDSRDYEQTAWLIERNGNDMNDKQLIERYIYAAVKNLPYKGREDIEKELETLIYDMLEERCGDVPPTEKDVRVVLTENGTPEELANNYSPDKDKSLIGPPYYSKWKWFVKLVLTAVLVGMLMSGAITITMQAVGENMTAFDVFSELLGWIGVTVSALLQASAAVTIVFMIMQKKKVSFAEVTGVQWETTPVPKKEEKISRKEAAFDIIFSIVAYTVFLCAPQVLFGVFTENGASVFVPVFNAEVIRNTWYFLTAFALCGIVREVFKYFEGRYTMRVAIVTGVCDVLTCICSFIWLTRHNILNPDFFTRISVVFVDKEPFIRNIFANFQIFFLCVLTFALALDFVVTLCKALKYDRKAK